MALDPVTAVLDVGGKRCRRCETTRPLTEFRWRNDNQKHRSLCKGCEAVVHHAKYLRNRDSVLADMQRWREVNVAAKLLKSAKDTARRKGLAFNLTLADIHVPTTCPYLGVVLTNRQGAGFVGTNASIDRIDSSAGYVRGNVQVISRRANSMKNDATGEELVLFARRVLSLHGGQHGS